MSVHGGNEEMKTELPASVGNDCEITIKGMKHTGKIAATGWYGCVLCCLISLCLQVLSEE